MFGFWDMFGRKSVIACSYWFCRYSVASSLKYTGKKKKEKSKHIFLAHILSYSNYIILQQKGR